MQVTKTERGFEIVEFRDARDYPASLQQSSAAGNYADAVERPGTSFVWLGADVSESHSRMHLDREQVAELIEHLIAWKNTGSFVVVGRENPS